MRLIDADVMKMDVEMQINISKVLFADYQEMQEIIDYLFKGICDEIDRMPTIEPTKPEIVRCRECKYYAIYELKADGTDDKRYKPSVCIKGEFAKRRKPDWFCADGERRLCK